LYDRTSLAPLSILVGSQAQTMGLQGHWSAVKGGSAMAFSPSVQDAAIRSVAR
jgi:hypothetical protein